MKLPPGFDRLFWLNMAKAFLQYQRADDYIPTDMRAKVQLVMDLAENYKDYDLSLIADWLLAEAKLS